MGLISALGAKTQVQFLWKTPNGTQNVFTFDASIKEDHSRASPPTEFPVENGDTISDHVIVKPFTLELTGMISDTPLTGAKALLSEAATTLTSALTPPVGLVGLGIAGAAGFALFNSLSGSKSPSVAAYLQLLALQGNATPFDVITSLYRYPSMWIKNISVPREAATGNAILFTVSLVQLILVTPQSVNISIFANPAVGAGQANKGQQGLDLYAAKQQYAAGNAAALAL